MNKAEQLWDEALDRSEDGDIRAALRLMKQVVKLRPADPDAWYDLALCHEAVGDERRSRDAFGKVWRLDRRAMKARPARLSNEQFDALVEDAVAKLDRVMRDALDEVALRVLDYPGAWILDSDLCDPRLLGLYAGPTWAELRGFEVALTEPPTLYLFQRNLERAFPDNAELAEEIGITLYHELGHFLGLSEDDLHHRGLE